MPFTGTCVICGNPVKHKQARTKVAKTCSRKCMGIMLTGENNPNYGNTYSEETRKKISEASKSHWKDDEYREKVSESRRNSEAVINHCRNIASSGGHAFRMASSGGTSQRRSYFGVYNPFYGKQHSKESMKIMAQKRRNSGDWTPKELLDYYYLYKYQVYKYTFRHNLTELENWDKRGKAGIDGSYHLDHIYSIKDGFINGIVPWIVGCYGNLQMIPWKDNLSKQGYSDITKEELYERFNKEGECQPTPED